MKCRKLMSIIIVLSFLTIIAASAQSVPFSLRNGYYWGISIDQASKLATDEGLSPEKNKFDEMIVCMSVPVGELLAEHFVLSFGSDNRLQHLAYTFPALPIDSLELEKQYSYLVEQLSSIYGVPVLNDDFVLAEWKIDDTTITMVGSSYIDGSISNDSFQYTVMYKPSNNVIHNDGF